MSARPALLPLFVSLLSCCEAAVAPSGRLGRRAAIQQAGALAALPLPSLALAEPQLSQIVPMATLLSGLANSPPRDVVIPGANSGVGLAGAKLLNAAGHRVVLVCWTEAKAAAAADARMKFAKANMQRTGGSARGAQCDLASLASIRSFANTMNGKPLDSLVLNAGLVREGCRPNFVMVISTPTNPGP